MDNNYDVMNDLSILDRLFSNPDTMFKVFIVIFFVTIFIKIVYEIYRNINIKKTNKRIRASIHSNKFIYYKDFEEYWILHKKGNKGVSGYKYNDQPGCYVILIFNRPVTDGNYYNYDDIYIGQSVKVCNRIHQHFNGKGNGDIYGDIKYGKHVYVQFITCPKEEMNSLEKKLIRAFNATSSYNKTKGGGTRR